MHIRQFSFAFLLPLTALVAWQAYEVQALSSSLGHLQGTVANLNAGAASAGAASSARSLDKPEPPRLAAASVPVGDERLEEAVARVTPAVVSIVPEAAAYGSAGTGFIVRANGYIVTNRHVVANTETTYNVFLADGKRLPATVLWRSPSADLAVLKIEGSGYRAVPLGDSLDLKVGQSVFAVGNALGQYDNSVSVGIVSGLHRTITASAGSYLEVLNNVIQTDAAINPGNSGGPLVNLAGKAIGVSVATVQGSQSIGFAIPINEVRSALAGLGI